MAELAQAQPAIDVACAKKTKPALELAAEELGWTTRNGGGGLVVWVVHKEDVAERLRKLRPGEWLAHIPGMLEACGKVALSEALQARNAFFWPRSWRVDVSNMDAVCTDAFNAGAAALIVKPDAGSQGHGISLVRSPQELRRFVKNTTAPAALVQEYVDPPLLLRGFKWDMRIYALVTVGPQGGFHSFLAREGLARVCIDPYESPDNRNLHRLTAHLTNYSLSKFSDKFAFCEDPQDATQGCKRTLSAALALLEQDTGGKIRSESIWQELRHLSQQTVSAITRTIQEAAVDPATWEGCVPPGNSPMTIAAHAGEKIGQCFHILGLDVILDEVGRPWLLEVNNNPSLSLDEIRPLPAQSRAETNKLFVHAKRECAAGQRWGRPCRCAGHPRPHAHHPCPVDMAVKLPIVQGALTIVHRARDHKDSMGSAFQRATWAQGTVFEPV